LAQVAPSARLGEAIGLFFCTGPMAPIAESGKELTWLGHLGRSAAAVAEKVQSPIKGAQSPIRELQGCCVHPESPVGYVPAEPRQWRGFEFADDLEQGLGPGVTTTYLEPPSDRAAEQRLVVQRAQNRGNYMLMTEKDEILLVARCNAEGTRYDFFIARDSEPHTALGPAFVLQGNANRDQWTLVGVRCDRCERRGKRQCGTRHLARMSHYTEMVGEGQAFCMDVEVPDPGEEGEPAVLCDFCGDSEGGMADLTTRRPKWNPRHKSLTLDFHGRCSLASAKNFQLEAREKPGKVRLLFGKIGTARFTLDYRHPLGMVQAFAAALTASHWK